MAVNYREEVYKAYKSKKWKARVNKMSDNQVFAIYIRLKHEGKL